MLGDELILMRNVRVISVWGRETTHGSGGVAVDPKDSCMLLIRGKVQQGEVEGRGMKRTSVTVI